MNWRPISEKPTPSNDFEQDGYKQTGGLLLWIQWSPTSGQHAMGQWTQFKDGVSHWGVSWISSQEPLPVTHWCEITPPAEPVPQSDSTKYEAELTKCADIVQRHHPIGAVKGIGLMEVATGLEELMQDLADFRRDVERLEAENKKLRKIAAHVPPRIYIKAKEDAGFGTAVVTDWMVQDETVDPVESRMVRLINGIKSLRRYVLVKGFAQSVDDAKSIGFAYDASQWGFVANPECDPYEALEECEKWLHGKLDALISIATKPAAVDAP